ncbi:TolC family protein [Maribacter sp. 1_MG-2023]|uniref:TolC family protein n=1 Tax=Maribacter sp. 1_MG-2023 TaxID=3062677 RepID=UPI0026E2D366|nr:TolC family protein [Maribacter sp. 1_MG-2023]MDO6471131.1 TolC family protein [Maribacter sp. 1_MG-2023]
MKRIVVFLYLIAGLFSNAQTADSVQLNFREYLGYVKKYHPIAKQAEMVMSVGQANLMKARGGFDPKISLDYSTKEFKGSEYYDLLNSTFKVPTWYGIELKGEFEQYSGEYLNAERNVPDDGLYSAGVALSLGRGSWINERMATVKKAKFFREQSKADRDLLVNQILFDASLAYFNWLQAYRNSLLFNDFLLNAKVRLKGVNRSAQAGEIAAIDTVEAKISVQNRALELEQANVTLRNARLELSNYLWMGENIPMELQQDVVPDTSLDTEIDQALEILGKPLDSFVLENHPKLKSLGYKIDGLVVDKRLKTNKLLPRIDVEYKFITDEPEYLNSFETQNYKAGLNFELPLFLRKERGDLKLAKLKLKDAQFELDNAEVQIQNKVTAIYNELNSFENQNVLIDDIVASYEALLAAEERKFSFGESSLFLINSRETKLIDAVLKQNQVENKYFTAKAKLFNSLAVNPENL